MSDYLERAVEEHDPSIVVGLFSGGNDSIVSCDLAMRHPRAAFVAHIDTGTGLAETREHVEAVCRARGWPLKVYKSPVSYEDVVRKWGTPGPAGHALVYNRLKGRAVEALVREHKTHHRDRILLASGLRRQESQRRMGLNRPVQRNGAQLWVNPCFDWDGHRMREHRDAAGLPRSLVSDRIHMSGECMCGAYAAEGERELIGAFFPAFRRWVAGIDRLMASCGFPWRWGERPPDWYAQVQRGQAALFDFAPLCSSCEWRHGAAGEG